MTPTYPDIDVWLVELRRRGWTLYVFGPAAAPHLVAATRHWPTCVDVILLRAEHDATAYRTSVAPGVDVFAPPLVLWQYHASATWTLRAALTLDPPGHPGAPQLLHRAALQCGVPEDVREHITIRPLDQT